MDKPLFYDGRLSVALRTQEAKMLSEINSLDEERILRTSEQDLCGYFVEKYRVNAIKIDESNIQVQTDDAKIDVSKRTEYVAYGDPTPVYVTGTRVTFCIPFTGDPELFNLSPSTQTSVFPRAELRNGELVMGLEEPPANVSRIQKRFTSEFETLKRYLAWVEKDLAPFNATLCTKVSESIKARRDKLLSDRKLAEQTGFKLRRREDAPTTYIAPQVKRRISPRLPSVSSELPRTEPTLATEDYE